jgi:hypothetical protein
MEETYYCSTCECDLAGKLIPWGKKLLCPDCVGKLKHNPLSHMAWGLKLGGWSVHFWPVTDTLDVLADWQIGGGILVYSPRRVSQVVRDNPRRL